MATPLVVTKEQVKAIKQADASVVFAHDKGTRMDGSYCRGEIRLERDVMHGQYIAKAEVRLECESRIDDYTNGIASHRGPRDYDYNDLSAFHMEHTPTSLHTGWHAFSEVVRAGDEVSLRWVRNGGSPWMDEHNVCHDQCFIVIQRGDREEAYKLGRDRKTMEFSLGYSITDNGSWTRLVRTPRELAQRGF